MLCRCIGVVVEVEDRNLQADFGTIVPLRRKHDAMGGGMGMLTRPEQIERLEEDPAEPLEISENCSKLEIVPERQMSRIGERPVEIQLKSDLHHMTRSSPHIERVMVKAHLPFGDHLAQGLFTGKSLFKI